MSSSSWRQLAVVLLVVVVALTDATAPGGKKRCKNKDFQPTTTPAAGGAADPKDPNAPADPNAPTTTVAPEASSDHPVVDAHNKYRQSLANGNEKNAAGETMPKAKNMYKLKWDTSLEQMAQKWADNCQFAHSQGRQDAGENLFMTSEKLDANAVLAQATDEWWKELSEKGANAQPPLTLTSGEFNKGNGHFTQCAWAKSTLIGCGVKWCEGLGSIAVCNYRTAGNLLNTPIYEDGEPCKADGDCTTFPGSKCDAAKGLCEAP
jgi:uncharacterized membrane protein